MWARSVPGVGVTGHTRERAPYVADGVVLSCSPPSAGPITCRHNASFFSMGLAWVPRHTLISPRAARQAGAPPGATIADNLLTDTQRPYRCIHSQALSGSQIRWCRPISLHAKSRRSSRRTLAPQAPTALRACRHAAEYAVARKSYSRSRVVAGPDGIVLATGKRGLQVEPSSIHNAGEGTVLCSSSESRLQLDRRARELQLLGRFNACERRLVTDQLYCSLSNFGRFEQEHKHKRNENKSAKSGLTT